MGASAKYRKSASAMALLREHFKTRFLMTDGEIDVVLKPHAKDPDSLLLGLGIAIPLPRPRGKTFVSIMTAPCKPEPLNPIGKANRKPRGIAPMDGYPYTCVGKGFATLFNSTDSEHRQAAPETSTSSQQAVPSTTTTDSTPPLNRADDSQPEALVSASCASDKVASGGLATPRMPETGTTRTRASDQPANVDRIDIRSDAKCLVSECGTDQAKPPPACNSHKSAMVGARPVSIVNENPTRLNPVVAAGTNRQNSAAPPHPTAPGRATSRPDASATAQRSAPAPDNNSDDCDLRPSEGDHLAEGWNLGSDKTIKPPTKDSPPAYPVSVVPAALNRMEPVSLRANSQHYEFSTSNLFRSGSKVARSGRPLAPAYAKSPRQSPTRLVCGLRIVPN
jgi:hypothetical protein